MENKPGYKHTALGWIPEDWKLLKLKEIISESRLGGNYENAEANSGVPVIKMGNLGRGFIKLDKVQYLPENEAYLNEDVLSYGALLFNTRNTLELVGKVAIWRNELPLALYNSNLLRIEFRNDLIHSNFYMNFAFNSRYSLLQLRGIATGTTSVAAIYGRDLDNISFLIPPLPEQKAIAKVISTWDKAIEKMQELIKQKELRKKYLIKQLLTGKKRLKGFGGEWKRLKIDQIANEVSIKNQEDKEFTVLSCTKYDGLVPSLEYFGRKIFADDLTTYKIVPKHHFAYATNHIEEGSIGYQDQLEFGLTSPMYTVFKTNGSINDIFLFRLLKTHNYILEYKKRMEGSIDRRGGLRWDEFSKIKILIPSIEEQNTITNILQKADKEISLLKLKLDALQLQKKGLMQVLLTGKKRINVKGE
jgi:type I restriction enzyme S subunit